MTWWIAVYMHPSDMQQLLNGGIYKTKPDWLKTKVDRVTNSLGLGVPKEHTCATVTNGRPPRLHPGRSFGPIEARLRFETIFPSLMVITERDLQDICSKISNKTLSSSDRKKFYIPTERVLTQKRLAYLSVPNGSIYPEVRISRSLIIDDIESFFEETGNLIWPTEETE